ncbi:MAG: peptidyl arginine deiminase, type II [Candidatus Ozemobacter sibiricus]|uniref:Peptidyl arginine deiminase, type II n=1 Tax=Candidatus Ozemobacter sibiricus TaxID=2268124 RepID=A0A367ZV68_9BACT|nr:MAG: peptidyl arginine deiminase, type II [Candidatus Ozemobacter sibiricus]
MWAAESLEAIDRIKFVSYNNAPQKVLVVHSYSTARFVKDLFNVIKEINEVENLSEADRIKLHIISSGGNPISQLGISAADAAKYVEVNPVFQSSDQWVQDCMELCSARKKGTNEYVPAVFDSVRGRGLGGLPPALAKLWDLVYFKNPATAQAHGDYGGNLEVTPFDDVLVAGNTITSQCKAYLEKWGYAGRMFNPDTRWLSVGHIDEYLMFIPTAHAPGGYSIVRADPQLALDLIAKAPDSEFATLNSSDRSFLLRVKAVLNQQYTDPNAGRGTAEGDFIELNYKIAEIIEQNVGQLKEFIRKVTNDPDRDFAEVAWPCVYEGYNGARPSSCHAYLPGVVNLTVLRNHLLVPATYFKPFDKLIEARFRAQGNIVHFIDDTPYHTAMGEIHCGTNVLRDLNKLVVTPKQVEKVQRIKAQFRVLHEQ